jgi:RNA polymerase sigma factor (sigma-70 family)
MANQETTPARIVIADDHPLFREALRRLLGGQPDLEVVGEAQDGQEALELCRRLRPDLVVMDVRMPKMSGLAATHAIKRELPLTIVVMLTAFKDVDYLSEALKAGAAGYVLKYASRSHIIDAIRGALSGESPVNHELAAELLRRLRQEAPEEESATVMPSGGPLEERLGSALLGSLTPREVEVLRLLMRGQTNQQIARSLSISVSTVKKHVRQIIAKLKVSDRTQAAILAIELGLLPEQGGE